MLMSSMTRAKYGYTVVEVLIVVSVIGILATIATISWNGVATNSRNNLRAQDINQWSATFDTYKGRYSAYPVMPAGATYETYCLGAFTDFGGKCGAYIASPTTATTTIPTEVAKVGKVPTNNKDLVVGDKLAGPILYTNRQTSGSDVIVTAQIINFFENSCPAGLTDVSSSAPASSMLSAANVSGAKACKLNPDKTFTYTP